MNKYKNGYFIGENFFRRIITKRAEELGLSTDIVDYLLQDFYGRDELANDVSINQQFMEVLCTQAELFEINISETERGELKEDYIAACCVGIYMRLQITGVKPEEAYRWFDSAWEFTKSRFRESERVKAIIRRSLKKKQLN